MIVMTAQSVTPHKISIPKYTLGEELVSSISHGIGALLSVAGLTMCIVRSAIHGSGAALAASIVYGISLIILYTMSCIYHALKPNKAKRVFRVFDHCSVFLLIAGTYAPYTLVSLSGATGWVLFGIIWASAILGITLNAIDLEKFSKVSVACYLAMGWAVIFAFRPLMASLAFPGLMLLVAGGVAYSLGVILYAIGSKKRYMHSVWHFFVLAGSILHFFSIYLYVI